METLRFGSRGESVRKLQKLINAPIDGIFGARTELAVKSFQVSRGLVADGIVGPKTWEALGVKESSEVTAETIKNIILANSSKLTTSLNNKNNSVVTFDPEKHLIVVAIRGFNEDLGTPDENDRRIYDDAHFIYTPQSVIKFVGNTDPNGFRKGHGTGSSKGMAMLNEGVWFYGKGPHNGRPSFRQCAPVQITRDGNPPYLDFGWFGINWHSGGDSTTSSLGCQTNRPKDFNTLRDYIYDKLDVYQNPELCHDWAKNFNDKVPAFPYILIDFKDVERGNFKV